MSPGRRRADRGEVRVERPEEWIGVRRVPRPWAHLIGEQLQRPRRHPVATAGGGRDEPDAELTLEQLRPDVGGQVGLDRRARLRLGLTRLPLLQLMANSTGNSRRIVVIVRAPL